jgi:hypothetical protein
MTDRHHAGDDKDIPGLEDVNDTDDPEEADEILEGLLGPDAGDRDDVPTSDETDQEENDESPAKPDETPTGKWACRFCRETRRYADPDQHHDACRESSLHWEELQQEADSQPEDDPDVPTPDDRAGAEEIGETPEEQHTYLVDTAWHEFRAYLKFDQHGLDPYYALHALMRRTDWHDGAPTREIEYMDTTFTVEFTYRETNAEEKRYEPWSNPEFQIERPREFHFQVEGPGDLRKASFHIRPRWPGIQLQDGTDVNNPRQMTGVDVDTEGSNLEPGAYPELLDKAMQAFGVNGGSDYARKRYLSPPNVAPWSVVIDGELYVRINERWSGRIIGIKGPLERMTYLLADERSGYRKRVADDTKREGYYHTTTLGSMRCRRLLDGHQLGKEIKHYHVKNPDSLDEDDPLRQPKVGVSLQRRISDTTVYWNAGALEDDARAADDAVGLNDMERELDEVLLNVLRWADIPTRPDAQVFVEDNVFKPDLNRRERRLVPDPLPVIENKQEHMVTRALNKMTDLERSDTDAQVVTELLADGGPQTPKGLAKRTAKTYETILRSLQRLDDVVEHNYGEVKLKSQHVAQQLAERAGKLLEDFGWVTEEIDRLGDQLANAVEGLSRQDSAFEQWAERYLEGIDDLDDDPRIILRFGYRPKDMEEAREILQDGLMALRDALGENAADSSRLVRWGQPKMQLRDGTPMAWGTGVTLLDILNGSRSAVS